MKKIIAALAFSAFASTASAQGQPTVLGTGLGAGATMGIVAAAIVPGDRCRPVVEVFRGSVDDAPRISTSLDSDPAFDH